MLGVHVATWSTDLLQRHGFGLSEVAGWAVHPGGPRILDVVRGRLGAAPEAMSASRAVLRDYGNCSSSTVLLVVDSSGDRAVGPGDPVVMMAFGPGLTLYAALLRAT